MTTTPQITPPSKIWSPSVTPQDERPRYAAQRMVAAQLGRLPQRIVAQAQSEGLAHHRRLEAALAAEQE